MKKINEDQYAFITKDGYDHPAVVMLEGEYKGVAWGYTKINLPQAEALIEHARLSFEFEILENAGLAFGEIDEEEFMDLMGDVLADQIDEQLETGRVQFA